MVCGRLSPRTCVNTSRGCAGGWARFKSKGMVDICAERRVREDLGTGADNPLFSLEEHEFPRWCSR